MARLSVIIPVFNTSSTLLRCVESVLSQNITGKEIILVDDGSTDTCPAMCDNLASAHPEIRVIHRANGGLSAARNTGIDASTGDWLCFIDSDDEFMPHTLSSNLEWLESHPETDLIEFPVSVHHGSPSVYSLTFAPETVSGDAVFRHWISIKGYEHCYAWNKIYRRPLFDGLRYPEGETFEDSAVYPAIIRRCRSIRYSDQGCYLYYQSPGGITLRYRFSYQEPLFRNNLKLLQYITDSGYDETDRVRLWNVCLNLLIDLSRCRDARKEYISENAAILNALRPGFAIAMRSGLPFRQELKATGAYAFGVRTFVKLLSVRKYS